MTEALTEADVLIRVTRLTRIRLASFIETGLVKPDQDGERWVFAQIDIARLDLLCDLSLDLELDDTALGIVVSLLDQLHAVRHDLAYVASTLETLPASIRQQLGMPINLP